MRLQFKSITRRADSDKHISMICEELEHEENPQCRELGKDYIGLIKDVENREALTRRFFLIFQYEAVGRNESDDYAKIYSMLQTAEQTARAYFMQCGNSIIQPKDPDEATAEILYMFYNRRSCTDEPFSSRVDRVVVDTGERIRTLRLSAEGYSCAEIGSVLGESDKCVAARISRTRKYLRSHSELVSF